MATDNAGLEQQRSSKPSFLEAFFRDIGYSFRVYRKSPGFSIVAILMLALGIGVNTAVYSFTYQILLRSLPVDRPQELVIVHSTGPNPGFSLSQGDVGGAFSYPTYTALRNQTQIFSALIARYASPITVAGDGFSERANGEVVSGNYFTSLGVPPALGRTLLPQDEGAAGSNPWAVLSYSYWTRRFGKNPDVLNKQIKVNGTPVTIIGVSRRGFTGVQVGQSTDVFVNMTMQAPFMLFPALNDPSTCFLAVMGRLKPGMSADTAQNGAQTVYHPIIEAQAAQLKISPNTRQRFLKKELVFIPGAHGRSVLQKTTRQPLLLLTLIASAILLLACANLAGLLIARGEGRQHEISVRQSLGASRGRLIQQLFTETLLLAFAGGIAGLLLAQLTLWMLGTSLIEYLGATDLQTYLSGPVLGFSCGFSFLAAILIGFIPALRIIGKNPQASLKNRTLAGASPNVSFRKGLLAFEVAATTILLAVAASFIQSLSNLRHVDLGLDVNSVFQFTIAPGLSGYSPAQTASFFERVKTAVGSLPGVTSVSLGEVTLFSGEDNRSKIAPEGYTPQGNENNTVSENWVGSNYFKTLGISLISGRDFTDADTATGPPVAIVNEKLAQQFFNGNALGRHFALSIMGMPGNIEIVGVVRNSQHAEVRGEMMPLAYFPYRQDPTLFQSTFYVRAAHNPEALAPELRRSITSLDANLPIYDVRPLAEEISQILFADRMLAFISLCFGLLAALLMSVGLYGVMAYVVTRRTREIGVRVALGAQRQTIAWLILREQIYLTLVGLAIGLGVTFFAGRLIQSLLFGIKATNPLILVAAALTIVVVSLAAGSLPAHRATRLNPVTALHTE